MSSCTGSGTLDKTLIGKQKWERRNIMAKGDNHSTEWTLLQTHTVQPSKVTHTTWTKIEESKCGNSNSNAMSIVHPLTNFKRFSVPCKVRYGCFMILLLLWKLANLSVVKGDFELHGFYHPIKDAVSLLLLHTLIADYAHIWFAGLI